jgi:hypothetical protein
MHFTLLILFIFWAVVLSFTSIRLCALLFYLFFCMILPSVFGWLSVLYLFSMLWQLPLMRSFTTNLIYLLSTYTLSLLLFLDNFKYFWSLFDSAKREELFSFEGDLDKDIPFLFFIDKFVVSVSLFLTIFWMLLLLDYILGAFSWQE